MKAGACCNSTASLFSRSPSSHGRIVRASAYPSMYLSGQYVKGIQQTSLGNNEIIPPSTQSLG